MPGVHQGPPQEKEHGVDFGGAPSRLRGMQQYIEGKLKGRDGPVPCFAFFQDEVVQAHPVVRLVRGSLVVHQVRRAVALLHEVQPTPERKSLPLRPRIVLQGRDLHAVLLHKRAEVAREKVPQVPVHLVAQEPVCTRLRGTETLDEKGSPRPRVIASGSASSAVSGLPVLPSK